MKLLCVRANHFKNCADGYEIDLLARSKKTAEDKEYELQEIAPDLYVYNTAAFIGKNASGKTSALELLDAAYSILGDFRLAGKHYSYQDVELEIYFYHDGNIYLYETTLSEEHSLASAAQFHDEHIYKKQYYKTNLKEIYDKNTFKEMTEFMDLPADTSKVFFVLKDIKTRAVYFDSYDHGTDTFSLAFKAMERFSIGTDILNAVLRIFDDNIESLSKLDERNYRLVFHGEEYTLSDTQLSFMLSSGTTKGILLYVYAAAALQNGFDLLVDEIENHFHKTLAENLIALFKDKTVNRHNASLIFSTHYCELLDHMGRQDNIFICNAGSKLTLSNMYSDYSVRSELLKSRQYYSNTFKTAVNYDSLMSLKKELKK